MTLSSNPRLQGKRVLVTAAAMGIGRASVLAMANQGAYVVATDRDFGSLTTAFNGFSPTNGGVIETHQLDVLDDSSVSALLGSMPAFDVLFNCAGYVQIGRASCRERV